MARGAAAPLPWAVVPQFPTDPADAPLAPGRQVGGRYELIRRIAKGGMAEVWEAEDTVLARPVAVKVLLSHLAADEAFLTSTTREVQAIRAVDGTPLPAAPGPLTEAAARAFAPGAR